MTRESGEDEVELVRPMESVDVDRGAHGEQGDVADRAGSAGSAREDRAAQSDWVLADGDRRVLESVPFHPQASRGGMPQTTEADSSREVPHQDPAATGAPDSERIGEPDRRVPAVDGRTPDGGATGTDSRERPATAPAEDDRHDPQDAASRSIDRELGERSVLLARLSDASDLEQAPAAADREAAPESISTDGREPGLSGEHDRPPLDPGRDLERMELDPTDRVEFRQPDLGSAPDDASGAHPAGESGGDLDSDVRESADSAEPRRNEVDSAPEQQPTDAAPEQQSAESAPEQQSVDAGSEQQSTELAPEQQPTELAPEQQSTDTVPKDGDDAAGDQRRDIRDVLGDRNMELFDVADLDYSDNPILGYRESAPPEAVRFAVIAWRDEVAPALEAGATREDLEAIDQARGSEGLERLAGVYDYMLGSDMIVASEDPETGLDDVINGRHRIEQARIAGVDHLPGRRPGNAR